SAGGQPGAGPDHSDWQNRRQNRSPSCRNGRRYPEIDRLSQSQRGASFPTCPSPVRVVRRAGRLETCPTAKLLWHIPAKAAKITPFEVRRVRRSTFCRRVRRSAFGRAFIFESHNHRSAAMRIVAILGIMTAFALSVGDRLRAQTDETPAKVELAQAPRGKSPLDRKAPLPKAEKKKTPNTRNTMELLTSGEGVAIKARQWMEILSKMDLTLTVRAGRPTEKIEITEKKSGGTLRTVMIRGMLDSKGQLIFPDKVFTESDSGKLAAWLDELRTYGAQGSPEGRPAWGLTKEQFGIVHSALKKPLAFDTNDMELSKVVEKIELPGEIPLRFSAAAAKFLKDRGASATVDQSLKGVSQGTALAVMLNDQGLAFRPRRLPDGTVELTVAAVDEAGGVWPVGWPQVRSPHETAPRCLTSNSSTWTKNLSMACSRQRPVSSAFPF